MGRELYEQSPAGRAVFEEADRLLGFALSALCFEGPEERLTATENAQPALLTMCTALLAALAEAEALGGPPAFVAGHSLGEYSALVAAGGIDFAAALSLVRRRGELMAAASAGVMAAIIGLEEEPLERVCDDIRARGGTVVIANYNAPGQLVISGDAQAVAEASALAKERGAKRALPLKVSAAFHSPLMREASAGMAQTLASAPLRDLAMPLLANTSAHPLVEAEAVREELAAQVAGPVRWIASVQYMAAAGVQSFVEIGPGNVLAGLVKRIVPGATITTVNTLPDR
jgi:[acyl-carrier-protein] S-malonyltransferase